MCTGMTWYLHDPRFQSDSAITVLPETITINDHDPRSTITILAGAERSTIAEGDLHDPRSRSFEKLNKYPKGEFDEEEGSYDMQP